MRTSGIAIAIALLTCSALARADIPAAPAPAATPAVAPAPPLDLSGSFFVRFETRRNYSPGGLPDSDFVRYRSRLGLITPWRRGDGLAVRARMVPQAAGFWSVGGDTLQDVDLGLHEGAIEIERGPVRVEAGRFEMTYGEHLVIGNVGWDATGRSFDGVRLHYRADDAMPWVDGFFTAISEGFTETPPVGEDFGAGDTYFTGLYAGLGPLLGAGVDLDAYLLGRLFPGYSEAGSDLERAAEATLGSRFKGKLGALDLRVEGGLQAGTRRVDTRAPKTLAEQLDVEVGLPLATGRARIAVEGFYASGDDPDTRTDESWNQLYPTAHKWLGTMDVIGGRSNVGGGGLHLRARPAAGWAVTVDGQLFWRLQTADDDHYAGTEIDAGAVRTLTAGLTLRGGYGLFLPGDLMGDDPLHFVEIELEHTL